MNDGITSEQHTIIFTEKNSWERFKEFLSFISMETATFVSVALTGWAFTEVLIAIVEYRPSSLAIGVPVIGTALVVTGYKAFSKYRTYVPEVLLSENQECQQIFRRQKFSWQWALAREMLSSRIEELDYELDRIRRGVEYIEPIKLASSEYLPWLTLRLETFGRLLNAVTIQCVSDLPAAIGQTKSEKQLLKMKAQIEALVELYSATTSFERECHAISPPSHVQGVHEMTRSWTDPIRDGVHEFIRITTALSELDKRQFKKGLLEVPAFKIKFGSPPNIEEFRRRMNEVDWGRLQ